MNIKHFTISIEWLLVDQLNL